MANILSEHIHRPIDMNYDDGDNVVDDHSCENRSVCFLHCFQIKVEVPDCVSDIVCDFFSYYASTNSPMPTEWLYSNTTERGKGVTRMCTFTMKQVTGTWHYTHRSKLKREVSERALSCAPYASISAFIELTIKCTRIERVARTKSCRFTVIRRWLRILKINSTRWHCVSYNSILHFGNYIRRRKNIKT